MVSCILSDSKIAVGDLVSLETRLDENANGRVLSFDSTRKVLVLDTKQTAVGKPIVRIFNANHLKTLKVDESAKPEDVAAATEKNEEYSKNGGKPKERLEKSLKDSKIMGSDGVTMKGQHTFVQLQRTIADTEWNGSDIRVLHLVVVRPPYAVENVEKDATATGFDEGRAESAVAQVQKILSKPLTEHKIRAPLDFVTLVGN